MLPSEESYNWGGGGIFTEKYLYTIYPETNHVSELVRTKI